MANGEKSLKVSVERHRRLKIVAANTGLGIMDALEKFGGPGIDAEYAKYAGQQPVKKSRAKPRLHNAA